SIDNLYADHFDKEGVVVYAAAFRLKVLWPAALSVNDLAPFELYTGTHRIGGDDDPDAESRVELPQPQED
ncbi:MAG TPA: hypothetical protein DD835_03745, partial [Halomonas sp.]|nr:hypothetical protein [Halomonas sp.]